MTGPFLSPLKESLAIPIELEIDGSACLEKDDCASCSEERHGCDSPDEKGGGHARMNVGRQSDEEPKTSYLSLTQQINSTELSGHCGFTRVNPTGFFFRNYFFFQTL